MKGRIQPKNLRQQVALERKRRSIIFFTVITLAFLYVIVNMLPGDMGLVKYLRLIETKNMIEAEVKAMEEENKLLQAHIRALKEDPYYIEKHAREEFGLAKPNEYIFQFQDN
jgi:cell division protein FtsB